MFPVGGGKGEGVAQAATKEGKGEGGMSVELTISIASEVELAWQAGLHLCVVCAEVFVAEGMCRNCDRIRREMEERHAVFAGLPRQDVGVVPEADVYSVALRVAPVDRIGYMPAVAIIVASLVITGFVGVGFFWALPRMIAQVGLWASR